MPIAYLATSAAEVISSTTAGTTSAAYDSLATGSDRVLVVVIFSEIDSPTQDVTAVTYGGVACTHVKSQSSGGGQFDELMEIWTLADPATGSNTLEITIGQTGQDLVVVAAVFTGSDGAGANTAGAAKTGSQDDYHGNLVLGDNSLGFYAAVQGRADSAAHAPVTDSTELLEGTIAATTAGFHYSIGYRGPEATGGTFDIGCTITPTAAGCWAAIELVEATAAPPATVKRLMLMGVG